MTVHAQPPQNRLPLERRRRPRFRPPRRLRFAVAAALGGMLLAGALCSLAHADTVLWTGAAGTNDWSSVIAGISNWSNSPGLPGASDDVINHTIASTLSLNRSDTINSFVGDGGGGFTPSTTATSTASTSPTPQE